jgi:hypothetical protein
MTTGSILLILGLFILVAIFVATPLIRGERLGAGLDPERSHWIAERERTLDALLELDFDQQLGKVPPDVYAEQRQGLMRQGAEALKQLEALGEGAEETAPQQAVGRAATYSDAQLEALIAKRKKRVG